MAAPDKPPHAARASAVSVIVPIRNERAFIEPCLRALLGQRGVPDRYEILVVDGMSDDGTREIVRRLCAEDSRLRMLDNPGRIVSCALNLGIAEARGEVIIRVDGHTQVAPDFVSENLELMREHPEAWSVGGPIAHRGKSTFARGVAAAMSSRLGVGGASHRREDYEGYAEGAVFPAFRKEIFERVGLFDEKLVRNQDDEFNFRITRMGGKIYISPRVKHDYYVRGSLKALVRQYMQYAYWKVAVFRKHKRIIAARHLAPMVFVLAAPGCVIGAIVLPPPFNIVLLVPLAAYAGVLATVFVSTALEQKSARVGASAMVAAAGMHVAYGVGTIFGILAPPGRSSLVQSAMERISR